MLSRRPKLRRAARLWVALLSCAALCFPPRAGAGDYTSSQEYQLKANFLAVSPNFVEWPAEADDSSNRAFFLCVYGRYAFGTSLAEMTRTSTVRGRRVELKWVQKEAGLRGCDLVFVSASEEKHYSRILQGLRGSPVLTIGETPSFVNAGGMVALEVHESKLQFDVSLDAAAMAHLKFSARLLTLARRVIGSGSAQAARS